MATGRIPINGTAAIQQTLIDAKGDLIAGTGADAVSRLAVGANGTTLVADSAEATGLKWATASSVPANATATVVTSESTTSTTFTDLTTSGPAVTLTTGTSALVIVGTQVYQNTADRGAYMGFAVSGATTIAASEAQAVGIFNGTATPAPKISAAFVVTLTAGSNTFTAKYKRSGASGTAVFNDRNIFVMNLA